LDCIPKMTNLVNDLNISYVTKLNSNYYRERERESKREREKFIHVKIREDDIHFTAG